MFHTFTSLGHSRISSSVDLGTASFNYNQRRVLNMAEIKSLPEFVQSMPRELYDRILELTLKTNTGVVRVDKDYVSTL